MWRLLLNNEVIMFKSIRIFTMLSIFLLLMFFYGFADVSANQVKTPLPVKASFKSSSKVIVYYFYAKPRCISCIKIETYTKEAVASMKNPNIQFKAVNIENAENKHYIKDYNLFTKSVILSKVKNGKEITSKNLSDMWTKLRDEKAFKNYVIREIKSFREK